MNMFFNTPYFMMLVIGIFGCVFVLIYDFIAFLIDKDKEEVAVGFRENIQEAKAAPVENAEAPLQEAQFSQKNYSETNADTLLTWLKGNRIG